MVNEIAAAVIGGFLGWIAIQACSYYVLRARLITYLIVQANSRLQAAHTIESWLMELRNDHSTVGVIPKVSPRYFADRAEDLHGLRELILWYLSKAELERVTKLLSYLWEVEYLTEGVCEAIGAFSKRGQPLTAADCEYLKLKVARVTSIISKWPSSIKVLDDLPIDYAGVQGPNAVSVPPSRESQKP